MNLPCNAIVTVAELVVNFFCTFLHFFALFTLTALFIPHVAGLSLGVSRELVKEDRSSH